MVPSASPGGGFFPEARDIVIRDSTMIDSSQSHHYYGNRDIRQRLYDHSIKGTQLDSRARHPPPRCHPDTRVSVTGAIFAWMKDASRRWNILWVFGFAGVGKTAVAQTVAERAMDENILGAAFFISRTRSQDDPGRIFISIAYQLFPQDRQYCARVEELVAADPGLLEKDMRTQFRKLIAEPLSCSTRRDKMLVIIDGLDECQGNESQREIIDIIASGTSQSLPVVWMICSRPEHHIKSAFDSDPMKSLCWKKEITVDDSEARQDIERFLWSEFRSIAEEYTISEWPSAADVEKLVNAASGLFVYADTVSRFVGDREIDDPVGQLEVIMEFIDSPANPSTMNPFHYLDQLYMEILKRVPKQHLIHALRVVGISGIYPQLPALQLANLLGLRKSTFEAALRKLYSIVQVPSKKPSETPLHIFHLSFIDFLKDPKRSGPFALDLPKLHADFAKACFGVISQTALRYAKHLVWKPEPHETAAYTVAGHILTYCAKSAWEACCNHGDAADQELLNIVIQYRYSFLCFLRDKIPGEAFCKWSEWLIRQIRLSNLENIVQPAEWDVEYLRKTFGSHIPDGVVKKDVYAFTLGVPSKRVMVLIINSSNSYFSEI